MSGQILLLKLGQVDQASQEKQHVWRNFSLTLLLKRISLLFRNPNLKQAKTKCHSIQ